jgi:two-component system LytT family response regulator
MTIANLRCVIIEDEPLAQELLEKYVRRVPSLQLIATFDDAIEAFEQLPTLQADLILLDINMPEMTGIEFLRAYPVPHPAVILTTANPNHALDGFDFGITDYLLKPIPFDRFLKAIGRVKERLPQTKVGITLPSTPVVADQPGPELTNEFIYLKTDKKLEQIRFDDIIMAEALGDYIKVFLADRFVVTNLTMNKLTENLPSDRFLRINRSFLVQLKHVKTVEGNSIILTNGRDLVIGSSYRDTVKDQIRRWLVA